LLLSIVLLMTPLTGLGRSSHRAPSPRPRTLPKRIALSVAILVGVTLAASRLRPHSPPAAERAIDSQPRVIGPDAIDDRHPRVIGPDAFDQYVEHDPYFIDEARLIDPLNEQRFDGWLLGIAYESGVDVRVLLARGIPNDIETYALKRIRELGVGRDTDRRGLLLVYDIDGQRMRAEVGPGLEGTFTDAFLGYLMREQTAAFFAADDRVLGLKGTLKIVTQRLREASLRETFDPRAIAYITDSLRLSAGGGANARAAGEGARSKFSGGATISARARFGPQPTVAAAHARYLEALRDGSLPPDLPLFTPASEERLVAFPISPPFAASMLFSEFGQKYKIVQRGDLAILFYTTTPLVSPHLFRRSSAGWQMDLAAEVHDTRERVGYAYTWTMVMSGDDYMAGTFADLFTNYGEGVLRPTNGDNRKLRTWDPEVSP
jgi:hypothetical protein